MTRKLGIFFNVSLDFEKYLVAQKLASSSDYYKITFSYRK